MYSTSLFPSCTCPCLLSNIQKFTLRYHHSKQSYHFITYSFTQSFINTIRTSFQCFSIFFFLKSVHGIFIYIQLLEQFQHPIVICKPVPFFQLHQVTWSFLCSVLSLYGIQYFAFLKHFKVRCHALSHTQTLPVLFCLFLEINPATKFISLLALTWGIGYSYVIFRTTCFVIKIKMQ